jgi:hypothetical protein
MPLFTDGPLTTLDQLTAQDAAVLDVASTEGIDATVKLTLAQNELGAELVAAVSRSPFSPGSPSIWWPGMVLTSALPLSSIVATQPLQTWHAFHTLELIYRDAYYNQLNDRYLAKWKSYIDLSKWASGLLLQTGVGIVAEPIPIAQIPKINVTIGTWPAALYFVQVAWLNSRDEEGVPSAVTSASASDESSIEVTPTSPPVNAIGWNAYVGSTVDSVTLQNALTLDPGQPWVLPETGLVSGRAPGTGQTPNYLRQLPRYLQRG